MIKTAGSWLKPPCGSCETMDRYIPSEGEYRTLLRVAKTFVLKMDGRILCR